MGSLEAILSQAVLRTDAIRDRVTGKTGAVLGSPAAGQGDGIKLAVVGRFGTPWAANTQAEIDAIGAGTWSPATEDFLAVMRNSRYKGRNKNIIEIGSTPEFIGLILQQKQKSIKEIRIITHGASATVGFAGEVEVGNVSFDDELDVGEIAGLQRDGIIVGDGDEATHQWSDVRARFRDDAVLVIYGCNVGADAGFIQELANEFGIRVQGFTTKIHFDFPGAALKPEGIDRRQLTVDGKKDFLDLVPPIDKSPIKAAPTPTPNPAPTPGPGGQ